jgi:hypothetical protein
MYYDQVEFIHKWKAALTFEINLIHCINKIKEKSNTNMSVRYTKKDLTKFNSHSW